MTLLSDEAKRHIANKFELPERRSKIASLIKQNEELYCICRTTDSTRFMIACDACDEWYHVDCVNLSKAEATTIKCYYCPLCVTSNPGLKTLYKGVRGSGAAKGESKREHAKGNASDLKRRRGNGAGVSRTPKKVLTEKKQIKCSCEGCHRNRNCGRCSGCTKQGKCLERRCLAKKGALQLSEDDDYSKSSLSSSDSDSSEEEVEETWGRALPKGRGSAQKAKEIKKKPVRKPAAARGGKRQYGRRKPIVEEQKPERDSSSSEEAVDFAKTPRQCYGPGCVEMARPNSKYCREYCGIALAHARIYAILPVRLTEWSMTPTTADEHNKLELEEVRRKYFEAGEEIKALIEKRIQLDDHIARVREFERNSDSSEEEQEEEEEKTTMYCVTCGHEISMKTCLKHMEKCFNKYEGKTTFGSIFKQGQIEGPPIFCDFYNPLSKTYCKRLAVLCAEHVKQPKIGDKELCGFPVNELTNKKDPFGKFCRVPKKKCNLHFSWEKLRRASIDMQRVRMYSRMDEFLEKDIKLRAAQKNRGALMNLLLNSTFNHELMNEKLKEQEDQARVNVDDDGEEESTSSSSS